MSNGSPAAQSLTKLSKADELPRSRADWLANEFRFSYAWLKSKLQRRVVSSADAEDIASSSFVELADVSDFSNVREPRALLTTISQRLVFEMWRRRDLERAYVEALRVGDQAVAPSPESLIEIAQALLLIDRALDGLSLKAKSAFLLSQVDGLTYAEIATLLGVSSSMVRKYIAQALTRCYLTN